MINSRAFTIGFCSVNIVGFLGTRPYVTTSEKHHFYGNKLIAFNNSYPKFDRINLEDLRKIIEQSRSSDENKERVFEVLDMESKLVRASFFQRFLVLKIIQ